MSQPWLLEYTKAVLSEAAALLELELPSSATKGDIVDALNRVADRDAVRSAVASAAGE